MQGRNNELIPDSFVSPYGAYLKDGSTIGMDVDGSSVNKTYQFTPSSGHVYVTKLKLFMIDPGLQSESNFGAINGGLTNGLQLKIKTNNTETEFFNFQTNGDMASMLDVTNLFNATGFINDVDSTVLTLEFEPTLTLDYNTSDFIKFIVRDDLTGLNYLRSSVLYWVTA